MSESKQESLRAPLETIAGMCDIVADLARKLAPDAVIVHPLPPDPEWADGYVISRFMTDALATIAGAVCTPEKGYMVDGGLVGLLADIKTLRKQHDALLEACMAARVELTHLMAQVCARPGGSVDKAHLKCVAAIAKATSPTG